MFYFVCCFIYQFIQSIMYLYVRYTQIYRYIYTYRYMFNYRQIHTTTSFKLINLPTAWKTTNSEDLNLVDLRLFLLPAEIYYSTDKEWNYILKTTCCQSLPIRNTRITHDRHTITVHMRSTTYSHLYIYVQHTQKNWLIFIDIPTYNWDMYIFYN